MEQKKITTEAEAAALDAFFTENTIMPKKGKPGVLTRMGLLSGELETDVAEYLRTQAAATRRTQAQVVGDLVRKALKAAMYGRGYLSYETDDLGRSHCVGRSLDGNRS
jgi:hypothetical protein